MGYGSKRQANHRTSAWSSLAVLLAASFSALQPAPGRQPPGARAWLQHRPPTKALILDWTRLTAVRSACCVSLLLHALVTTGRADAPSTATFNRWVASLEKALLDWIHLGASSRSRMTRPPFDLNPEGLD